MKLEIQNRIWADRNLESKTNYLFKNQPFFSQKANSRFFLDLWYWITTIYMYLKFVVFLNQETWKTINLNMMNLIFFNFNLIILPAVPWEVQVWNWLHFQSCKLDISNKEKYYIQLENVKNQVQIDRGSVKF